MLTLWMRIHQVYFARKKNNQDFFFLFDIDGYHLKSFNENNQA